MAVGSRRTKPCNPFPWKIRMRIAVLVDAKSTTNKSLPSEYSSKCRSRGIRSGADSRNQPLVCQDRVRPRLPELAPQARSARPRRRVGGLPQARAQEVLVSAPQATTIFNSLSGTKTFFRTVLPSSCALTAATVLACANTASSLAPGAASTVPRCLPFT